jgi:RNA polymerase sigma factor (sigma-70 family)
MESLLIKKAISGDKKALAELIDTYKDVALNLAFSIVKNRADAMDITQDSLVKVVTNIERFRNEAVFSTWLYRIVYNSALKYLEKEKRKNNLNKIEYINETYHSDEKDPDLQMLMLKEEINKLADKDQQLITLFYLAEKSIKDISRITGVSPNAIKVSLHRVRKKLSEKLKVPHEH